MQLLPLPQLFCPLQDAQPLHEAAGAVLQAAGAHGELPQAQPAANTEAAATARAKPNLFITKFPS